jgi:hypothetical protein
LIARACSNALRWTLSPVSEPLRAVLSDQYRLPILPG